MAGRYYYGLFASLLLGLCLAGPAWGQEKNGDARSKSPLTEIVNSLTTAFNRHDSRALAAHWRPDGVHVTVATGEKLTGREAIAAAYERFFKRDPESQLALRVSSVRPLSPDVLSVECTTAVRHTGGEVSKSDLNVLLVREGDRWLIDQVRELETPVAAAGDEANPLADLDWLVGYWSQGPAEQEVVSAFRWTEGNRFLSRTFRLLDHGEVVREGKQIIGWDPAEKKLRCWLFSSDGSFGEGTCTREGEQKWVCKFAVTTADGRRGTFTQILTRQDEDALSFQLVDRELDGQAHPSTPPVTLQRIADDMPEPDAEPQQGGGGFF